MQALRSSSTLARLVLVWFALALGSAIASPIVHPKAMEIVCSAEGLVKIVVTSDDGQTLEMGQHTLDCALCLPVSAPPPSATFSAKLPQPLAHALRPVVAARLAALVGAPLPARGPPRAA